MEPSSWERCMGMCGRVDSVDGASGQRRMFDAAESMSAVF